MCELFSDEQCDKLENIYTQATKYKNTENLYPKCMNGT